MKKNEYYFNGNFGLERETLRVDSSGRSAQTPHPFGDDEYITRDFCENQIELITPVCQSAAEAVAALTELDRRTSETLSKNGERIWLYSNPPHFETEDDIPIAAFGGDLSSKRDYREALQRRYGKRLMLFSGVHFNFSFADELLREWHKDSELPLREFIDELYLRLYRQLSKHSWLLVLLTAASPWYDISLDGDGLTGVVRSRYSSMRNSERGYWNEFVPILEHESIAKFTDSIRRLVEKGMLFSVSELYLPVRLKPRGVNTLEALAEGGVDHIELRMFDLDPLTPVGIDERDLSFAHLLMLWLLTLEDGGFAPEEQKKAWQDHKNAALYDLSDVLIDGMDMIERAKQILHNMSEYFGDEPWASEIIGHELEKLETKRLCERINEKKIYG